MADDNRVIFRVGLRRIRPTGAGMATCSDTMCPSPCDADFILVTPVIPPEYACYMSSSEAALLFAELNEAVRRTSCVVWLFCFCCPLFLPIGFLGLLSKGICNCRRTSLIEAILKKWNLSVLVGRGCHL